MSLLRFILTLLGLVVVAVPTVRAEKFADVNEAQKLMFPSATSFSVRNIRYTPAEIRAIEKKAGVKLLKNGNRMWIAHAGTNVLGVMIHDQVFGKHELIDYAVAIDLDGRVQSVEILEYRESYGGEIRGEKWRAQFRGKGLGDAFRLNRDIYNLSGATMSCRHVSEGVKRLVATYALVVRPRVLDPDLVPNSLAATGTR